MSCYHYGWVRTENQMNLKSIKVQKYWGNKHKRIDYSQMDNSIIAKFEGSHPQVMMDWIVQEEGIYQTDSNYKLTTKQKKHRVMLKIEKLLNIDLSKKHYKLV